MRHAPKKSRPRGATARKGRSVVVLQDTLRAGGTERHSVWLADTLQSRHHNVRLLLFQPPERNAPWSQGRPDPVQALQQRQTPFPWYAPGLIRKLRELRADLVLCMGRNANSYGSWIRRRLPGVRIISTCRTNRHLPFFYRAGIRRSDWCVANSDWAARCIVDLGLKPPAKVSVIPNALLRPELYDLDRSPAAVDAARLALDLPRNQPILCNVASFVPGKNKQGLLRAFARSREARNGILLLVGAGPELRACRELATSLGLDPRVRFLGHTEEIGPLLQASNLFVSTALRDALPNALVEAQAAGLPVIAFDTGGCTEAIIDGESGSLVPSDDETAFAERIDDLLSSPEKRAAFSAAARVYAQERFHPKEIAARYHSLIREELQLMDGQGPSSLPFSSDE